MKNVLLVLSSPRGNESYSHRIANHAVSVHGARIRSFVANSAGGSASAIIAPRQSMKSPDKGCSEASQRACSSVG